MIRVPQFVCADIIEFDAISLVNAHRGKSITWSVVTAFAHDARDNNDSVRQSLNRCAVVFIINRGQVLVGNVGGPMRLRLSSSLSAG